METGDRLKELRLKAGLSRDDVASALGVTIFTVGHWETGRRKPRFGKIEQLAALYNTTPSAIVGDEPAVPEEINFLDKVIIEMINEGSLNKNKLFNNLDDNNKQILTGALNKHILNLIEKNC